MILRVFPRMTSCSPIDDDVRFGSPLLSDRGKYDAISVSCTFSWDIERALELQHDYTWYCQQEVSIGGPAFKSLAANFTPGLFMRKGITITSRGCPNNCSWCFVSEIEPGFMELEINSGNIVYDNNLLGCSKKHIQRVFEMLKTQRAIKLMNLDINLLRDWHVEAIKGLKINELWFSYDWENPKFTKQADLLQGFPQNKKRCYVLIGFKDDKIDQADARCRFVYELGFLPFAMLWQPLNARERFTHSKEWRQLQRFWARPAIYRNNKFKEDTNG